MSSESSGSGSGTAQDTARQQSGGQSGQQTKSARPMARSEARPMNAGVALTSDTGNTRIAEGVVAKIAGLAARDVPGVYSMGSGMARRVGQVRSMIPGGGGAETQGVSVEVGEKEAAVDLNVVTWYGQSIVEISEAVRRNVIGQVEGMTGLRVVEVNIEVDDIQVEGTGENGGGSASASDQQQRAQ